MVYEATVKIVESGLGGDVNIDFPINVMITINNGEVESMLCIELTDIYKLCGWNSHMSISLDHQKEDGKIIHFMSKYEK